ncbi:peptidase inhibitor family I36 protein [Streptomyces sp. NPDC096030]|uniref:peptidase inhibitor family I36 protein n=1 Tax=Streptomyces sp. NPDC096030 TaxID=3155423 RepID=UPI00332036E7
MAISRASAAGLAVAATVFACVPAAAASPEVIHIPATQTTCFPKHICFYRDAGFLGGGIAVRAGFDLNNLAGSLDMDNQMTSWRNASTERYCWHPDPHFAGLARVMRAESEVALVAADENDIASAMSSC